MAPSSHYHFGMQIMGAITKGLLVALTLTLVPTAAYSAQKFTPGSTCKVLNQKVVYQSKTYTCIKSGKKLVWNKGIAAKTPTPTPTPTPSNSTVGWRFNGSAWVSQGEVLNCPTPLIAQGALLDFSKVVSFVQPGQIRGGSYKPHAGLRWSEYGGYVKGVTITAPFDGEIVGVAQYKEGGIYQFLVNVIHPCGVMLRLGHLLEPSDFMKDILKSIPPAIENDSRESFLSGVYIKKGQVIATEVGMPPPASPDSLGTFMDLGILNLRARNPILPLNFSTNADIRYSLYSLCWYEGDYFSAADRTKVVSLPFSNGDATSDYCKPSK
jgi:hypothetical protein